LVAKRELETLAEVKVTLPDVEQPTHLQLRRFAGCPICNLHLQRLAQRHDEVVAAGIKQVVVFHSTSEELSAHQADLPFAVVADPERVLYREFGVESSWRALLNPRVWAPVARGLGRSVSATVRRREPPPVLQPNGGRLGLPADFLIASDGRILACRRGSHAYDQWSVDELLSHAGRTAGRGRHGMARSRTRLGE
jgi:hypothetical protein